MKTIKARALQLIALTFALVLTATAQPASSLSLDLIGNIETSLTTAAPSPHVEEYFANPDKTYNPDWWNSLKEEISLEGQSYRKISVEALQNVIFFGSNFSDRVDLTASTPILLDVFFYHKNEGMRIMAMSALYEIGDSASLKTVQNKLYKQQSERAKRFAIRALTAYHNN